MPEMLGMMAGAAAENAASRLRQIEPCLAKCARDARIPFGTVRRRAIFRIEQLVDEAPHPVEAEDHARAAFFRTVAKAHHPFVGEARMIGDFLHRLRAD